MIKILCFTVPAIMAFLIKQYILKKEIKLMNAVIECFIYFITINLFVSLTALIFGSTIITKCEENRIHIQYGLLAIVLSNIYSLILGVFCSFVMMNRNLERRKDEKN